MINDNFTPWLVLWINIAASQENIGPLHTNWLVTQANIAAKAHIGMHVKEELIKSQHYTNLISKILF